MTNILLLQNFNTSAARAFNARLAQVNLITKTDLDTELKKLVTELLQIIQTFAC